MIWRRDGVTWPNSGETSGMDAPNGTPVLADFTAYYTNDAHLRASFTYYVWQIGDPDSMPETPEYGIDYVLHAWAVDDAGNPVTDERESYTYDSATPLAWPSLEAAVEQARMLADEDESDVLLWEES